MRAGCAVPAAALSLEEGDRLEADDRLEYAMRGTYPGGTHDPALWAALVPEVRGGRRDGTRLTPHAVRLMTARLRSLPAGPLGPLETHLCQWVKILPLLLPEEFYGLAAPGPTAHLPGSEGKIEAMTLRATAGRELSHPGDAGEALPLPGQGKPKPAKNFKKQGGGGGRSDARHRAERAREAEGRTRTLRGMAGGRA